ncbi:MAG TPA: hypothetical protein VJ783_11945 [Pirellulales bacterium]|nr:hypothetical protein [Pirellulales bacterium]
MHVTMMVVIVLLNTPLYFLLARSFFGSWEGFFESFVAIITPDIVSAASGNYYEHRIGRFTLFMFLLVCASITAAEYHVVARYLFGIERPWG